MDYGLPQYFRGLAIAELLPGGGRSEAGRAAADTGRADQVIADFHLCKAFRTLWVRSRTQLSAVSFKSRTAPAGLPQTNEPPTPSGREDYAFS